jgi:hypothetical protein
VVYLEAVGWPRTCKTIGLAALVTSEYNIGIQDITRSQHKESTEACLKRDASDLEKIHLKLEICSPFTSMRI